MLSYIAAIATAATLFISPILSHANETTITTKKAPTVVNKTFVITKQIVINTPLPAYKLSKVEQSILRNALFKSVKILSV